MHDPVRPRLIAVPAPPDMAQRVRILSEVVDSLLERTEVLEEQHQMLTRKIEILEAPTIALAPV